MIDKEHIETKKATVMSIPEQNLQINSYFYERYPDGSQDDPDKKSRPLLSDPQLNEIRNTIAELDDLVEELNVQRIKRKVTEFQSRFVDNWIKNTSHTDFYSIIRISSQKSKQAKRRLGNLSEREEASYYLGMLAGIEAVFQILYTAEERDRQVVEMASLQSARTDEILRCLYTSNGGQGMRHGELAKAIGVSYSSLTNTMKKVLQSGAVTAVRTGKNTFYTLTPVGQRYCSKKQDRTMRYPSKKLMEAAIEIAYERPEELEDFFKKQKHKKHEQSHYARLLADMDSASKEV